MTAERTMKHALPLFGLLAAIVPLAACGDAGECIQIDRPPVTDPEAPLILGVTFGELMTVVVGERSGPLQWASSEPYVHGFPAPGETRITVTVHEPRMVEEIDLQKRGGSRFPGRNERLYCAGWVEAVLELDLQTDDGALDTTVTANATFHDPDSAVVVADLTTQRLGAVSFDPVDPTATLHLQLSYRASDSNGSAEGTLVLRSGSSDGGGSGVGMAVELATWALD
jgi:hypothetical protein